MAFYLFLSIQDIISQKYKFLADALVRTGHCISRIMITKPINDNDLIFCLYTSMHFSTARGIRQLNVG